MSENNNSIRYDCFQSSKIVIPANSSLPTKVPTGIVLHEYQDLNDLTGIPIRICSLHKHEVKHDLSNGV